MNENDERCLDDWNSDGNRHFDRCADLVEYEQELMRFYRKYDEYCQKNDDIAGYNLFCQKRHELYLRKAFKSSYVDLNIP